MKLTLLGYRAYNIWFAAADRIYINASVNGLSLAPRTYMVCVTFLRSSRSYTPAAAGFHFIYIHTTHHISLCVWGAPIINKICPEYMYIIQPPKSAVSSARRGKPHLLSLSLFCCSLARSSAFLAMLYTSRQQCEEPRSLDLLLGERARDCESMGLWGKQTCCYC